MRLLSNSQNMQIPFYLVLFIQGSMSRDPPNMIRTHHAGHCYAHAYAIVMCVIVIKLLHVDYTDCDRFTEEHELNRNRSNETSLYELTHVLKFKIRTHFKNITIF